jgi:hypothetical protein
VLLAFAGTSPGEVVTCSLCRVTVIAASRDTASRSAVWHPCCCEKSVVSSGHGPDAWVKSEAFPVPLHAGRGETCCLQRLRELRRLMAGSDRLFLSPLPDGLSMTVDISLNGEE